jgi:prevent-host-death family protein
MQRAHAGETFLVTRRGKPYVRLLPADDQASLDDVEPEGRDLLANSLDPA